MNYPHMGLKRGDVIENKHSGQLYEVQSGPTQFHNLFTNDTFAIKLKDEHGKEVEFGMRFVSSDFNII